MVGMEGSKCCLTEVKSKNRCSEEGVTCVINLAKFIKLVWDRVSCSILKKISFFLGRMS